MSKAESGALRRIPASGPLFDEAAVARAEQALADLSANFQDWLEEEVEKVQAARLAAARSAWAEPDLQRLLHASHDLKGLGATYSYPLATRIAASLCRLLQTPEGRAAARARPALIEAHVDAIRAAARNHIKTEDHEIGRALLLVLERQVTALSAAWEGVD
ncbi:MAG: Hpt domain-containing protein [Hyphomonadaceae bacterium]